MKSPILMFSQSSISQCGAQAGAKEDDEPFDFMKSVCADVDASDWLKWSDARLKSELGEFKKHWSKGEEISEKMTKP